jgi:hypothetical protein
VTDYGIPGFTFLQEIIKLTLLLQNGQRPNFIVFYDGANDVYAAYQSGRMVDFLDYRDTQEKLENSPLTQGMKYLIAKCRIVQAVEKTLAFVGYFRITSLGDQPVPPGSKAASGGSYGRLSGAY